MANNHALCIGINDYPGLQSDLRGCVNDAEDWEKVLQQRNHAVVKLLDAAATKKNMVEQMKDVIARAQGGSAVITYSGHGTWVPDDDGDESDSRDEALCPYDLASEGPLLDDELYTIFSSAQRGTRVVFISDSCHSGTVSRVAAALTSPENAPRSRYMPLEAFVKDQGRLDRAYRVEHTSARGKSRVTALLMAGCRDTQTSADAYLNARFRGAYTAAALTALAQLPEGGTYAQWQKLIRTVLPSRDFDQVPQLVGTSAQRRWRVFA